MQLQVYRYFQIDKYITEYNYSTKGAGGNGQQMVTGRDRHRIWVLGGQPLQRKFGTYKWRYHLCHYKLQKYNKKIYRIHVLINVYMIKKKKGSHMII